MHVRNDIFDKRRNFDRGRGVCVLTIWQLVKCIFFETAFPWPCAVKVFILKIFGAVVGEGCCIKPNVNVHFPWKLEIGDHAWIGEGAYIINLEPVRIGAHACISQRAILCTGNHDYRDPAMSYRNAPIVIGDGAWIGAQTFVCPGLIIGSEAVITAGSVVTQSIPNGMVCSGNPCIPIKPRWRKEDRKPEDCGS